MNKIQEISQGIIFDEVREKFLLVGSYHNFKKTNKFVRCRRLDDLVPIRPNKI
jgi:hypothetical protein